MLAVRYAHLINLDFFGDLLVALKELITAALEDEEEIEIDSSSKRNANREALLCVITAFALLSGQGRFLFPFLDNRLTDSSGNKARE